LQQPESPDSGDKATSTRFKPATNRPKADRATPLPPAHKYGTDEPRARNPNDLFVWVCAQDNEIKSRLVWYVYRHWPVIQIPKEAKGGKPTWTTQIDKVGGEDSFINLEDFLRRYGSGDYQLLLNDAMKLKKTIARCKIRNMRDPEQPPVIKDLKHLVVDDPANQSYITYLLAQGVQVPGRESLRQIEEESDDMKVAEVSGRLLDMNQELVEKNQELAERLGKESESKEGKKVPMTPDAEGAMRGMEMIQKAGEIGFGMIDRANDQITAASSKGQDPVEMLKSVMTVVKEALPKNDTVVAELLKQNSELAKEVRDTQGKMFEKITEMTAARIEELRERASMVTTAVAVAPKTLIEQLQELQQLKTLGQDLGIFPKENSRRNPDDDDDEDGRRPSRAEIKEEGMMRFLNSTLPGLVGGAATLFGLGANIVHNFAVARVGQGAVESPAAVVNAVQTQPVPPQQQPIVTPPPPGSPATVVNQPNGADNTQVDPATLAAAHRFMAELEPGLIAHFFGEETNGVTFAEWIISNKTGAGTTTEGRQAYDFMHEAGKTAILATIQSYPPIWNRVGRLPLKLNQFIEDFLNYDEIISREDGGDDAGGAAAGGTGTVS